MKVLFLVIGLAIFSVTSCFSIPDFGPEVYDDTEFLQSLLNEEGPQIIIPAGDRPWYTQSLTLSGANKEVTFEKGCYIRAQRGRFIDPAEKLITIQDAENLTLSGYGAQLYMPRADYQRAPYKPGQWRHAIAVYRSSNITIQGLRIEGSGGDGVYIGQNKGEIVCENISLQDLDIRDQHRQGVSVIAVKGFLMEKCTVSGTKGTSPSAGIDFEPNSGLYGITGAVIKDCHLEKNAGPGFLVNLQKMTPEQPPVDILVEHCVIRKNLTGISICCIPKGVRGTVEFRNCNIKGINWIRIPQMFNVVYSK